MVPRGVTFAAAALQTGAPIRHEINKAAQNARRRCIRASRADPKKHTALRSFPSIDKPTGSYDARCRSFERAASGTGVSLLESIACMADWKQITARIRRARTGKDPAGQLANLFSKTRDAMVAFELARYFESTGNSTDAGKWYLTAAQRFRRSDWKTKAQESAARLGATEAAEVPAGTATEAAGESSAASESAAAEA